MVFEAQELKDVQTAIRLFGWKAIDMSVLMAIVTQEVPMDGVIHVELPQDYAIRLRRLHRETKIPVWRLVATALDHCYGDLDDTLFHIDELSLFPEEDDDDTSSR